MIWLAFAAGIFLALGGATVGAGLVALGRLELTRAASRRLRGDQARTRWLGRIDRYLAAASATMSLGIVLLGAVLPALTGRLVGFGLALLGLLIAFSLVLSSGSVVPGWLERPRVERAARRLGPLLRPWGALFAPLLPARNPGRIHEIQSVLREGAAEGLRTDEELMMAAGVMTFSDRTVREVMTPRTDVVALAEDAGLPEIHQVFAQSGYTRIPVYRGTLDEIVGMLHAFDLFKLHPGDPLPVRPVAIAPASRRCGDLLLDMQRERRHLGIVLDEFGGTLGLVTLEDLLEELVGEISDEHDEHPPSGGPPATQVFETDGATPTAAVGERFGVSFDGGRATTVGGLLTELAGRIPLAGERFVLQNLEFDVLQASPNRVERVVIRPGPVAPTSLPPAGG